MCLTNNFLEICDVITLYIYIFFIDILQEILRKLNQLFFKVKSIDDRLSNWEMRNQSYNASNVLSVENIISLPIKTFEALQLLEKDLEAKNFSKVW